MAEVALSKAPGGRTDLRSLTAYRKTRCVDRSFVSTGHDPEASKAIRNHLANELAIHAVGLDEAPLPGVPGVWCLQCWQGQRHGDRSWRPDDEGPRRGTRYEDDHDN